MKRPKRSWMNHACRCSVADSSRCISPLLSSRCIHPSIVRGLIRMKDFCHDRPPLTRSIGRERFLQRIGVGPPLAGLGVIGHLRHIGCEVLTNVLEVRKEEMLMTKDGVVADIAGMDGCQDVRPDSRVQSLILLDGPWFKADDLSKALHTFPPQRIYESRPFPAERR